MLWVLDYISIYINAWLIMYGSDLVRWKCEIIDRLHNNLSGFEHICMSVHLAIIEPLPSSF
jgi:hypothetical protein